MTYLLIGICIVASSLIIVVVCKGCHRKDEPIEVMPGAWCIVHSKPAKYWINGRFCCETKSDHCEIIIHRMP